MELTETAGYLVAEDSDIFLDLRKHIQAEAIVEADFVESIAGEGIEESEPEFLAFVSIFEVVLGILVDVKSQEFLYPFGAAVGMQFEKLHQYLAPDSLYFFVILFRTMIEFGDVEASVRAGLLAENTFEAVLQHFLMFLFQRLVCLFEEIVQVAQVEC